MKFTIIPFLISVLAMKEIKATCEESRQLEGNCGSYCYTVVRPLLDYVKMCHGYNDRLQDNRYDKDLILKFEDLRRTIEIALLTQVDHNAKQNSDSLVKLQNFELSLKDFESRIANRFEKQNNLIESIVQKHLNDHVNSNLDSFLIERASAEQNRNIQIIQERTDAIEKNLEESSIKLQDVQLKLRNLESKIDQKLENLTKETEYDVKKQFETSAKQTTEIIKSISQLKGDLDASMEKKFEKLISNYNIKLESVINQLKPKIDMHDKKIDQKLNELQIGIVAVKKSALKKPFRKIGSKHYYIETNEKVNWFAALHKCIEYGGHLVSIQNLNEFNALKSNLNRQDYWIDISDLSKEGTFLSAVTGVRANYLNWLGNNPDNYRNQEHCGEMWFHHNKHEMNDANCWDLQYFICETENIN